jgi:hypothetical protein
MKSKVVARNAPQEIAEADRAETAEVLIVEPTT